ncbi:M4 family metallopeptidase [Streptomyces sp. NBC_01477]|uniref:M4 family metallopeptidase n=1 Tax=Streptomyces sp. NBC_01477 TaxID=2976015 RepID=UPI002E344BEF|nr:M4 family metallopeptidase [Streptomyces sp. NBC_01477]
MKGKSRARILLTATVVVAATVCAGTTDSVADSPAVGSGTGVYVGTVPLTTLKTAGTYLLKDPTRGNTATKDGSAGPIMSDLDNVWGNGLATNRQSAAVDAQFTAASVWDYFKFTFNRIGVRNDGQGIRSVVHYSNNYSNVFWDDTCVCVSYGDGSGNGHPITELDVGAREITHGVTSVTAGLSYTGEAGALNEATSDIFGTMVEFYANIPADVPDYFLGEKIDWNGDGTPLRSMDRPSRDGASPDYYSKAIPGMDPSLASGVADHFFFLLAEGSGPRTINGIAYNSPTANGSTLAGIGRDAAAAIWYRALANYLTSTDTYHGARLATLNAAADLYGTLSPEYAATAAAWTAVSVP